MGRPDPAILQHDKRYDITARNGDTMNNVIEFNPSSESEETTLVCDCGCVTFLVLSTGQIECSSCQERMDGDVTSVSAVKVSILPDNTETSVRSIHDTVDFAFNKTLSQASVDSTNAIVILNDDGSLLTWSKGWETQEQKDWYADHLGKVMDIIGKGSIDV